MLLLHLAAAAVLLAVLCRPVYDSDLFWQLRLGEIILDTRSVPAHEPFLADKQDEPFTPVAWAGQAAYALLRRLGGWPLLHVADGLLWVGGLAAVGYSARRTGAAGWAAALAVLLAGYAAYSSVSTRPQTFGLFFFGLLAALVRGGGPGWAKGLLGAGLLVAWQNFHPSAAVGGAWLGGVALAGWARRLWRLRRGGQSPPTIVGGLGKLPHTPEPSPWVATLLVAFVPAAMVATPGGVGLLRVSAYNAEVSRWMEVNEWLPLWELELRGDTRLEVWVALAALVGVLLWRGRRVRAEDLVPAVLLGAMAVASYRFAMFWAVAAIPVWAAGLCRPGVATPRPMRWRGRAVAAAAWAVAVAVPGLVHPTHLADYVPWRAVERLRAAHVRGTVYCNTVWAGVLIDRGHPDWKVSHDGRYYLRSKEEWNAYHAAGAGSVPVAELDRRHRPAAFVLRAGFEDGLIGLLRRDSGWVELAAERDCVVFVRAVEPGPPPR